MPPSPTIPSLQGTNAALVKKIRSGKIAAAAELTSAGASQLGATSDDYAPCSDDGQDCANDIFAVSLPLMVPSGYVTWFQAQEACTNSGKHLPSNALWQAAANGTADAGADNGTTDCNTALGSPSVTNTGSRSGCVSARGAFDMVGNRGIGTADGPFYVDTTLAVSDSDASIGFRCAR